MAQSENKIRCNSCKNPLTNQPGSVRFPCPECADYEIVRCKQCRITVSKYQCPNCHFEGPN